MSTSLRVGHLGRYARIAALLVKHGRSTTFAPLGEPATDDDGDPATEEDARALVDELESMGPTFVKLGQVLSTRPDMLPPEYVSELARLQARTREADKARLDATAARKDAMSARADATAARLEADESRANTMAARLESEDLQRQIEELNARETDRGLVVTLGDLLFETGKSDLKGGAAGNLSKLALFLNEYPDRSVLIEGHTDNVGTDETNFNLSQRRANSVQSYLVGQGIAAARLSTSGLGEGSPVAGNDTATGRQQNRRVEVIISNATTASR